MTGNRHVRFGGGRLETQVRLCAGRLPYCNIYVKSERAAQRVMESTSRFIERRMRLKVNTKNSAIGRAVERQFLGFSIYY
jgi:hypothetical protein